MSPLWISLIVVLVCVFAVAALYDFRRRNVRDMDKRTSTPGYATRQRRDQRYRADMYGPRG